MARSRGIPVARFLHGTAKVFTSPALCMWTLGATIVLFSHLLIGPSRVHGEGVKCIVHIGAGGLLSKFSTARNQFVRVPIPYGVRAFCSEETNYRQLKSTPFSFVPGSLNESLVFDKLAPRLNRRVSSTL